MFATTIKFDSRRKFSPRDFAIGLVAAMPVPDPLDGYSSAFGLGLLLGKLDREFATPPDDYTAIEREGFLDGLSLGLIELDSERARDWADEQEQLALQAEWADSGYFDVLDR